MKILHHCCREWTEEFSCYSQGQDLLRDKWCVSQLPGTPWTLTTTWYNAPLSQRVQSASRLPQILRESKVCRIANCPSKQKLAWSLSLKNLLTVSRLAVILLLQFFVCVDFKTVQVFLWPSIEWYSWFSIFEVLWIKVVHEDQSKTVITIGLKQEKMASCHNGSVQINLNTLWSIFI